MLFAALNFAAARITLYLFQNFLRSFHPFCRGEKERDLRSTRWSWSPRPEGLLRKPYSPMADFRYRLSRRGASLVSGLLVADLLTPSRMPPMPGTPGSPDIARMSRIVAAPGSPHAGGGPPPPRNPAGGPADPPQGFSSCAWGREPRANAIASAIRAGQNEQTILWRRSRGS